jgi:hypothetical protein
MLSSTLHIFDSIEKAKENGKNLNKIKLKEKFINEKLFFKKFEILLKDYKNNFKIS